MESGNSYEHNKKTCLISVDVHFGCAIKYIHAEDLLAAKIKAVKIKEIEEDNSTKNINKPNNNNTTSSK